MAVSGGCSAPIRVEAFIPPNFWGEATLSPKPGTSNQAEIVFADDKEPSEDTDLEIVEALDGALRPGSSSFTLRFVEGGALVPMLRLEQIEWLDHEGNQQRTITDLFQIAHGVIVAKDPGALLRVLPADDWVVLNVDALDAAQVSHSNRVPFRIGR